MIGFRIGRDSGFRIVGMEYLLVPGAGAGGGGGRVGMPAQPTPARGSSAPSNRHLKPKTPI